MKDTLPIWDMQLLEYGQKIIKSRRKFVSELNEIVTQIHSKISGGREEMILTYEPNVTEDLFEQELIRVQEKDLKLGQTNGRTAS